MNIHLYNYTGMNSIANKLKDLSPVYSGDIVPYGRFDSQSVVFRLDTEYVCNYCQYGFNGNTYMGYVNVSVDSEGLYVYRVNVDPLTTAWYKRCMNTLAFIQYSKEGTNQLFDDRITTEQKVHRQVIEDTPNHTMFVAVRVLSVPLTQTSEERGVRIVFEGTPSMTVTEISDTVAQVDNYGSHHRYSVGYRFTEKNLGNDPLFPKALTEQVYIMSVRKFQTLYKTICNLEEEDQAKYMPSILGCYMIPREDINDNLLANTLSVDLLYMNKALESGYAPDGIHIKPLQLQEQYSNELYRVKDVATSSLDYIKNVDCFTNIGFNMIDDKLKANFRVQLTNGGIFEFNPCAYTKTNTINSIGYAAAFNPSGMNFRYFLRVNGTTYFDTYTDIPFQNMLTIAYDQSVSRLSDYVAAVTGGLGQVLGIANLSVPQMANYTAQEAQLDSDYTKFQTANYKVDSIDRFAEEESYLAKYRALGASKVASGVGMALSAASAVTNAIASGIQVAHQHATGSYGTIGGTGYGLNYAAGINNKLIISYYEQIDRPDYQALYGLPKYEIANIELQGPGYVKTSGCELPANGLPAQIISLAQQICDIGFRIQ